MTDDSQDVLVDAPEISSELRAGRLRRRSLRRSSSEDVIVIESPVQADSSRAVRRRRRMPSPDEPNSNISIVDLTCSPDEVVDLTSPEIAPARGVPSIFEISDEETDQVHSPAVESPVPQDSQLFSCPVCLERFSKIIRGGGQIKSTICGHVFCSVCIQTAIHHSKKCPTCRKKLDMRKIHVLYLPV